VSDHSASPIVRAVAELVTERQNLAARLAKVDEAIASLRALFHLPSERANSAERKTKILNSEDGNSKGDKAKDAIRAALKLGPLSTAQLGTRVHLTKSAVGYHVRQMKADGELTFLGAGKATTVALAGAAAKEGL
jgi:hypothetical protein